MATAATFQIEKGIECPKAERGRVKYPLGAMDVGDSFLVPNAANEDIRRLQSRVSSAVSNKASPHVAAGKHFATRAVEGGVRVWRTA